MALFAKKIKYGFNSCSWVVLYFRAHTLYSTVDDSPYELKSGPTRKNIQLDAEVSPPTLITKICYYLMARFM